MALCYLLDTNICIYIAKQQPPSVMSKFEKMSVGSVGMSMITYAELYYGAQKSHLSKKSYRVLEELIGIIPPIPIPIQAAKAYGEIRHILEKKGKLIGGNDLWIAAHALSMKLTVVTNNLKEFSRVPKLHVENWVN